MLEYKQTTREHIHLESGHSVEIRNAWQWWNSTGQVYVKIVQGSYYSYPEEFVLYVCTGYTNMRCNYSSLAEAKKDAERLVKECLAKEKISAEKKLRQAQSRFSAVLARELEINKIFGGGAEDLSCPICGTETTPVENTDGILGLRP